MGNWRRKVRVVGSYRNLRILSLHSSDHALVLVHASSFSRYSVYISGDRVFRTPGASNENGRVSVGLDMGIDPTRYC